MAESERSKRLRPASKEDLFDLIERVLFMNSSWMLYVSVWSMEILFALFGVALARVVAIPDEDEEAIYIREARRNADGSWEKGTLQLDFNEQHTAAWLNLHYAIARFNKNPGPGRRLAIPASQVVDPDLGPALRLDIKRAKSVKGDTVEDSLNRAPVDEAAAGRQDGGPEIAPAGSPGTGAPEGGDKE